MKILLVGLGNQGKKRFKTFKKKIVATVDKFNLKADFEDYKKVPLDIYDTVVSCVPDNEKFEQIKFFLKNKKHVMLEKPFLVDNIKKLKEIQTITKKNNICCYVAYNHRFEPSLKYLKKILDKKLIGKIYFCNFFYGNGTSFDVKKSKWKDKSKGVAYDLGSHLIDYSYYLFNQDFKFKKRSLYFHENKSNDHAYFFSDNKKIKISCEVNLLTWKNTCRFEIVGSKGRAVVQSLQKWGGSKLILQKRKFPSGIPKEKILYFEGNDPTWDEEAKFFSKQIRLRKLGNINNEIKIYKSLSNIV